MKKRALVTGAGGFIGHHMVHFLKQQGYVVYGADRKKPEFASSDADKFFLVDLRDKKNTDMVTSGVDEVYNFAANMGGVGYIDRVHAEIMHDNLLINIHMLQSSVRAKVKKFFFSSSACVYPKHKQLKTTNIGLSEPDAFPADPDTVYGWEKLTTEQLCASYHQDFGLETRVARFHNIYGPLGTWQGGREKSPAAICRKIAMAKQEDTIEIWGDGKQTRSYCFIDDCLAGVYALMQSNISLPVNIGSDRLVSIHEVITIVANIAGKTIHVQHDLTKPQGVRGRNADIRMASKQLHWKPNVSLEQGLQTTYNWIEQQIKLQ